MGDGVQSLERGLRILELLARRGTMTAAALAAELGVHPSSASRLLASLHKAGFVRKPDFRAFAPDYGVLLFAGRSLAAFPLVRAATDECNRLQREEPGYSATVAVLWGGRLIYLTRVNADASHHLIDDAAFPLHRSSVGLALVAALDAAEAVPLLSASLRRAAGERALPAARAEARARRLYDKTRESIDRRGYFFADDLPPNRVNAALRFVASGRPAALAVFGGRTARDPAELGALLLRGVERMGGLPAPYDHAR